MAAAQGGRLLFLPAHDRPFSVTALLAKRHADALAVSKSDGILTLRGARQWVTT